MKKSNNLKRQAELFKKDGVILFPTDTVVGLGCRFDSVKGIDNIRQIKGISSKNPLALLISDEMQLDLLMVRRSRLSNILIKEFWPGGLTIVLTAEKTYPCSGEGDTLGLRMPDSDELRSLIDIVGVPIAATSANFHGMPPPAGIQDVDKSIRKQVRNVIDLDIKYNGLPSTVVKIEGGILRIQREGAISKREIAEVTGIGFE